MNPYSTSDKIAKYAFGNAINGRRSKVTAIHQANIKKECHGEFLHAVRKVAKDCPSIGYEELLLGPGAAKLAMDPASFDVIVSPNSCRDVVSSIAMSLVGGEG